MKRFVLVAAILLLSGTVCLAGSHPDLDRSGSIYLSPKFGYSLPVGALADRDYNKPAASWRKDGVSLTLEAGYYLSSTSVFGIEASYSTFNPKRLAALSADLDQSRVRFRRFGIFWQYQMVPTGRYRPFIKIGAGIFEASRFALPQPANDPVSYSDYSLGGKPVFSLGLGFLGYISQTFSAALSVEAVSMNSTSSSWETSGASSGPLNENQLFFPIYLSILYHLPND